MNVETYPNVAPLSEYQPEWASLCTHRHNVLIEGPAAKTHAVLLRLQPHIGKPIVWKRPHAPLELPGCGVGALVLENVSNLSREDQMQLLAYFDAGTRTQVVSTSEHVLYRLVARNRFDVALYYRLNVVLLRTWTRLGARA